ncbi:MAG: DinB family protein [Flavobacteriales bacterium]
MKPEKGDYAPYYQSYIDIVTETDVVEALNETAQADAAFIREIDESLAQYAYEPGKWSIAEVVQHVIDAERVFAYRALCIARGETINLPGFNENEYASKSAANGRSLEELADELETVRYGTAMLFESFDEEMWARTGTSNNNKMSVAALASIIVGHSRHHMHIIEERYLE